MKVSSMLGKAITLFCCRYKGHVMGIIMQNIKQRNGGIAMLNDETMHNVFFSQEIASHLLVVNNDNSVECYNRECERETLQYADVHTSSAVNEWMYGHNFILLRVDEGCAEGNTAHEIAFACWLCSLHKEIRSIQIQCAVHEIALAACTLCDLHIERAPHLTKLMLLL